jgi:hypothetical protein
MHYGYYYYRKNLEEKIQTRAFEIKARLEAWASSYASEGLDIDCHSSPLGS